MILHEITIKKNSKLFLKKGESSTSLILISLRYRRERLQIRYGFIFLKHAAREKNKIQIFKCLSLYFSIADEFAQCVVDNFVAGRHQIREGITWKIKKNKINKETK